MSKRRRLNTDDEEWRTFTARIRDLEARGEFTSVQANVLCNPETIEAWCNEVVGEDDNRGRCDDPNLEIGAWLYWLDDCDGDGYDAFRGIADDAIARGLHKPFPPAPDRIEDAF